MKIHSKFYIWHINSYLFNTGLANKAGPEAEKGPYVLVLRICFVVESELSNLKQRQMSLHFEKVELKDNKDR